MPIASQEPTARLDPPTARGRRHALQAPWGARIARGAREVEAWLQLVRFATVGASGYVVNLVTFTLLVTQAGAGYRTAATGAFVIAVSNNFLWNHRWTFRMAGRAQARQAARFLCVSLAAFAVNLAILSVLVDFAGLPEVFSQAVAIVAATPLSFLGNRLWTFSAPPAGRARP